MGLERVGGAWLSPFLSFTLLLNYSWLSSLEGTSHLSHSYWPRGSLCHQRAKCRAYSLLCFHSLMSHVQTSGLKFPRGSNVDVISTCYGNKGNKPTASSEVCHPRCLFKLYGEVNSVKNTINIWLNDGDY